MKTMRFYVDCVRNCLVENKEVFTVRKYKSFGLLSAVSVDDVGTCRKQFLKTITNKKELEEYVKLSGFNSVGEWFKKIRMFISENENMYLYKVSISEDIKPTGNIKEVCGNIWNSPTEVICVTTNGIVKRDGKLVMGAGQAREAVKRHNNIAECYGDHVKEYGNTPCQFHAGNKIIMSLPTKDNWMDSSDIDLIEDSIKTIAHLMPEDCTIAIPRVGCGLGGLDWEDVKPRIEPLLDERFTVYAR